MDERRENRPGEEKGAYRPRLHSGEVHGAAHGLGHGGPGEIEDVLGEGEAHSDEEAVDEAVHRPVDVLVEREEYDEQAQALGGLLDDRRAHGFRHDVVLGAVRRHAEDALRPPPVAVE